MNAAPMNFASNAGQLNRNGDCFAHDGRYVKGPTQVNWDHHRKVLIWNGSLEFDFAYWAADSVCGRKYFLLRDCGHIGRT